GAVLATALGTTFRSGASAAAGEPGVTLAALVADEPAQEQPNAKPKAIRTDAAQRFLIEMWINELLQQPQDKAKPGAPNALHRMILERWLGLAQQQGPTDAEFIRRIYLDITGTLPSPDDVKKFLADTDADKRAKLVDRLLAAHDPGDRYVKLAQL